MGKAHSTWLCLQTSPLQGSPLQGSPSEGCSLKEYSSPCPFGSYDVHLSAPPNLFINLKVVTWNSLSVTMHCEGFHFLDEGHAGVAYSVWQLPYLDVGSCIVVRVICQNRNSKPVQEFAMVRERYYCSPMDQCGPLQTHVRYLINATDLTHATDAFKQICSVPCSRTLICVPGGSQMLPSWLSNAPRCLLRGFL